MKATKDSGYLQPIDEFTIGDFAIAGGCQCYCKPACQGDYDMTNCFTGPDDLDEGDVYAEADYSQLTADGVIHINLLFNISSPYHCKLVCKAFYRKMLQCLPDA